jgi:hypothetical protein
MAADGKHASGRIRLLTDSTRKRNRKEAWGNYYRGQNRDGVFNTLLDVLEST